MIAVTETSRALMGGGRHTANRSGASFEAHGMTFEVALYGPTLNALRAAGKLHGKGIAEAIRDAVEDYIATQGLAMLDGIGQVLAANDQAKETGAVYP